jgi:osmotically-inducible protein OsmY
MTLLKHCSALLIAAVLSAGCASTDTRESTGEYVDDTVITTRVKSAIFNEPSLKVLQINVETYKSVVQLSGFVSTWGEMNRAVNLARDVKGVRSVKNDIQVK